MHTAPRRPHFRVDEFPAPQGTFAAAIARRSQKASATLDINAVEIPVIKDRRGVTEEDGAILARFQKTVGAQVEEHLRAQLVDWGMDPIDANLVHAQVLPVKNKYGKENQTEFVLGIFYDHSATTNDERSRDYYTALKRLANTLSRTTYQSFSPRGEVREDTKQWHGFRAEQPHGLFSRSPKSSVMDMMIANGKAFACSASWPSIHYEGHTAIRDAHKEQVLISPLDMPFQQSDIQNAYCILASEHMTALSLEDFLGGLNQVLETQNRIHFSPRKTVAEEAVKEVIEGSNLETTPNNITSRHHPDTTRICSAPSVDRSQGK